MIKCDRTVGVLDRDQRLVEAAFGEGLGGSRLTDQREVIYGIAINALQRGDGVSADTLL